MAPDPKTQRRISAENLNKGAAARSITVTQSVPVREGARAPQVVTPATVPSTGGPVSVTKPK